MSHNAVVPSEITGHPNKKPSEALGVSACVFKLLDVFKQYRALVETGDRKQRIRREVPHSSLKLIFLGHIPRYEFYAVLKLNPIPSHPIIRHLFMSFPKEESVLFCRHLHIMTILCFIIMYCLCV